MPLRLFHLALRSLRRALGLFAIPMAYARLTETHGPSSRLDLPGLGLVSVSPWSNSGASATTLHVAGGIALVLMAVMASALGGYLAARLRTKWVGIHTDEVYFRDSAHGLLAWAFATIITATVLASAAGLVAGNVASVAQVAAANPALTDRTAYLTDTLFRSDRPVSAADQPAAQAASGEASRILARGLGAELTAADRTRLAQLVSARTGLPQAEAERALSVSGPVRLSIFWCPRRWRWYARPAGIKPSRIGRSSRTTSE